MMSMPKGLTASTGLDALTHAIESYITPGAWTMSDMFEYKAIELIHEHLYNAVQDGNDVKEWDSLMWVSVSFTLWLILSERSMTLRTALQMHFSFLT